MGVATNGDLCSESWGAERSSLSLIIVIPVSRSAAPPLVEVVVVESEEYTCDNSTVWRKE